MRAARLAVFLAPLLIAACASLPPPESFPGESLSGRLAVKVDAYEGAASRSVSATFELRGDPTRGRLDLSTPLGSMMAQARWAPGSVVLATPQGERRYAGIEELTGDMLGEQVPVPALFDWLRGRPWPGAPSAATVPPAEPGFDQLGWTVSLAHYDDALIVATRRQPPVVTVRAKLDRP